MIENIKFKYKAENTDMVCFVFKWIQVFQSDFYINDEYDFQWFEGDRKYIQVHQFETFLHFERLF